MNGTEQPKTAARLLAWLAAGAACAAVFALYTHPEVLISLADQVWACF